METLFDTQINCENFLKKHKSSTYNHLSTFKSFYDIYVDQPVNSSGSLWFKRDFNGRFVSEVGFQIIGTRP